MEDKNVEMPTNRKISRRVFLKLSGAAAAGAAAGYVQLHPRSDVGSHILVLFQNQVSDCR